MAGLHSDKLERIMSLSVRDVPVSYDRLRSALYAVSIGLGGNPIAGGLQYTFEGAEGFTAFPTQVCVIARPQLLGGDLVDRARLLHGEQRVRLFRPLPGEARMLMDARIRGVVDKGAGKGALVYIETVLREENSSDPLAALLSTIFLRGDGGLGSSAEMLEPVQLPQDAPDIEFDLQTRVDDALLYRLNGDLNPLHADPAFAVRAGFERPILHGLLSYGRVSAELAARILDYDAATIRQVEARFRAPLFPGDVIRVEAWVRDDQIMFRAKRGASGPIVLEAGRILLGLPGSISIESPWGDDR